MSKVIELGICKNSGDLVKSVNFIEVVKNKGIIGDRKFKDDNDKKSQITLIEIENINHYNQITRTSILPKDFRRNIITEGIDLNKLINKEFFIGNIKIKAHDLCRPCKYLENLLNQNKLVKLLLLKAGIRCEILSSGKIFTNDIIKTYD